MIKLNTWYVSSTGNHQGLIIDESTGENIAVTYDKKHAPLIAESPNMLKLLKQCRMYMHSGYVELNRQINETISKAEGRS